MRIRMMLTLYGQRLFGVKAGHQRESIISEANMTVVLIPKATESWDLGLSQQFPSCSL
jgi:hypothetical protein